MAKIRTGGRPGKTPVAKILVRGNSKRLVWSRGGDVFRVSLGAVNVADERLCLLQVNAALAGGEWPAWSIDSPAVQRYLAVGQTRPSRPEAPLNGAILQAWEAHAKTNAASSASWKNKIGRVSDFFRWLGKPVGETSHSDAQGYLDWIQSVRPTKTGGTAGKIIELLEIGSEKKIADVIAALAEKNGEEVSINLRHRVEHALRERPDLFRRIRRGVYRRNENPDESQGRSRGTRNRALAAMRVFFRWLIARGYATENPFEKLDWLSEPPPEEIVWCDREERDAIIAAAEEDGCGMAWWIAFYSGLRLGEIARLRWADVSMENGWITVGTVRATKTKTGRARQVPLFPKLRERLERETRRKARVVDWPDEYSDVAKTIRERLQKNNPALAEKIGFNIARHTFCSLLAQSGKVSVDQIAAISGHTPEVCRRNYAHLIPRRPEALGFELE